MSNMEGVRIDENTMNHIAKRNLAEILTEKEFNDLISQQFSFYYGTAPTGPFHVGYVIPLTKFVDLVRIGGKGKILIADWHAYLDDRKTPWESMEKRSKYYYLAIKAFLGQFIDVDDVKFVFGHEFQRTPEYEEDLIRASGLVTVKRAIRAASEVVRLKENPHVSELIYPIMQCLDVKYLNVDMAIGGVDQRHIYALAREILPQMGYKKGVYAFTPIITSLTGPGNKMSASKPNTTITIHDTFEAIKQKLRSAYCPWGTEESNPILELYRYIVFPLFETVKVENTKTKEKLIYNNYGELLQDFKTKRVHPMDLKETLASYIWKIVEPIQQELDKNEIVQDVLLEYKRLGIVRF